MASQATRQAEGPTRLAHVDIEAAAHVNAFTPLIVVVLRANVVLDRIFVSCKNCKHSRWLSRTAKCKYGCPPQAHQIIKNATGTAREDRMKMWPVQGDIPGNWDDARACRTHTSLPCNPNLTSHHNTIKVVQAQYENDTGRE